MPSIEQIIRATSSIKVTSDELAQRVGAAGQEMSSQAIGIAAIVQGSATGQEAATAVGLAARALSGAATSMKALSRACDDCIANLSK